MTEIQALSETAKKAALIAGQHMRQQQNAIKDIQTKSSEVVLVTHVDLECDKLIRDYITEKFPTHTLLTEETFKTKTLKLVNTTECWIIDPIDGTTNYAHGFPHSAVSIAYAEKGKVLVGVIFDPFKDELFHAVKGQGAFLNDSPIHVSQTETLRQALVATGFAFRREADADYEQVIRPFIHMLKATRDVRRAGSAALDMAYVACGRLDAFYEHYLSSWDIAAGLCLIQEAGGFVSTPENTPLDMSDSIQNVVASNGKLQSIILSALKEANNLVH